MQLPLPSGVSACEQAVLACVQILNHASADAAVRQANTHCSNELRSGAGLRLGRASACYMCRTLLFLCRA